MRFNVYNKTGVNVLNIIPQTEAEAFELGVLYAHIAKKNILHDGCSEDIMNEGICIQIGDSSERRSIPNVADLKDSPCQPEK